MQNTPEAVVAGNIVRIAHERTAELLSPIVIDEVLPQTDVDLLIVGGEPEQVSTAAFGVIVDALAQAALNDYRDMRGRGDLFRESHESLEQLEGALKEGDRLVAQGLLEEAQRSRILPVIAQSQSTWVTNIRTRPEPLTVYSQSQLPLMHLLLMVGFVPGEKREHTPEQTTDWYRSLAKSGLEQVAQWRKVAAATFDAPFDI